ICLFGFAFALSLSLDFNAMEFCLSHPLLLGALASMVLYHNRRSKPNSLAEEIATVVKEVDKVHGMVFWSPLYWESIEMLARDEVSRGIFYALPDESKLHYLKRKTKASMDPEQDEDAFVRGAAGVARLIKSREEYAELTHLEKVTFGVTKDEIIRALNQPKAWPAIIS
ncbi:hypothetical protein HID58_051918, partial [Brassica napus]